MSLPSAVIDALIASGCTVEQLGAAMKAANEASEARREAKRANNAERQARYRARHADVTQGNALRDVTNGDSVTQPPLSRPPNENISNPPTHTPPDNTSGARGDDFPCPESVDPTDWLALKANRKAKRAPLTTGAHRQIVKKLDGWARDGWPPGPIVAAAAERGWTTVFETDEMKAGQNGRSQTTHGFAGIRGSRPNPALDMVLVAEREMQAERESQGSDWPIRAALPSR